MGDEKADGIDAKKYATFFLCRMYPRISNSLKNWKIMKVLIEFHDIAGPG